MRCRQECKTALFSEARFPHQCTLILTPWNPAAAQFVSSNAVLQSLCECKSGARAARIVLMGRTSTHHRLQCLALVGLGWQGWPLQTTRCFSRPQNPNTGQCTWHRATVPHHTTPHHTTPHHTTPHHTTPHHTTPHHTTPHHTTPHHTTPHHTTPHHTTPCSTGLQTNRSGSSGKRSTCLQTTNSGSLWQLWPPDHQSRGQWTAQHTRPGAHWRGG